MLVGGQAPSQQGLTTRWIPDTQQMNGQNKTKPMIVDPIQS